MCTECLFKYVYRFGATWMMPKRGLRGAFLGTDSCKSFGGSEVPINSCYRTQQTNSVKWVVDYPQPQGKHQTPDWRVWPGGGGMPGRSAGRIIPILGTRGRLRGGEVKFTGGQPPSGSGEAEAEGSRSPGRAALLLCFIPQPRFVGCWPGSQKTLPPLSFWARSETWWFSFFFFFFFPSLSPLPSPFSELGSQAAAYNAGS